jgi:hypothetical protein
MTSTSHASVEAPLGALLPESLSSCIPVLGTQRFQPHLVLGDASAPAATPQQEEQQVRAPERRDSELRECQPCAIPGEVWHVARLLPEERGKQVLDVYNHLVCQRCVAGLDVHQQYQAHSLGLCLNQLRPSQKRK